MQYDWIKALFEEDDIADDEQEIVYPEYTIENFLDSGNLYQIFTYVKNKDYAFGETPHKVSGLLLYAKTEDQIHPDQTYQMHGNEIGVKTLDLNLPFEGIRKQLDGIVREMML